jgi:hypothetical protein
LRKHLKADALIMTVRDSFEEVTETRNGRREIIVPDAIMSAVAMFFLNDPLLVAFEARWEVE